jgi:hypothetical protein
VVHDVGETSSLLLQSDGGGAYESSVSVLSQIYNDSGDWVLDLSAQTERSVRLAFVPVSSTSSTIADGYYNARVLSRCFDGDGHITGFLQMQEGSSNERCSLRIVFTANRAQHVLVMSPLYAGTGWARVSCPADADSNDSCENWTIKGGTAADPAVASLLTVTRSNKELLLGSYYLSFSIGVTRP